MIFLSGGTTLKGFGKAAGVPNGTWASGADIYKHCKIWTCRRWIYNFSIAFTGSQGPASPTYVTTTELWNGSSWTEVNDLNTGRYSFEGAGTSYDAVIMGGGYDGSNKDLAEVWNGTNLDRSW